MSGEVASNDETESRSQITNRSPISSSVEISNIGHLVELRKQPSSSNFLLEALLNWTKIVVDIQGNSGNTVRLILLSIAVSMDPLFFYIPIVNDNRKCIILDSELGLRVTVLRSVFDLVYLFYITPQLHADLAATVYAKHEGNSLFKRVTKFWSRSFLVDLPAVFPLPQLVILPIILRTRGLEILNAMMMLKYFVLIQFVPRMIRVFPWTLGKLAEATWVNGAFNLLLFMLASHVFGALWYFSAIERLTECWKKACLFNTGCSRGSFDCDGSLGNYEFLNEFCPTKIRNATILDFGIFQHALQSGIVEVSDFPQKFLHCFRWGMRNISCFGQNLQTSSDAWENFFVILVTISGLGLVLFLIGNMQVYLQLKATRPKEVSVRMQEMNERMPIQKLSKPLQQQLKIYQRYQWRKPDIDVESSLSILPKELKRNIKRELCLNLIKKVKEFKKLEEEILDALCDCVKPAFYFKNTYIALEGDPIYEMLFVVQGKLLIYTSKERMTGFRNICNGSNSRNIRKKDDLADSDVWGEELVTWAVHDRSLSNIPMSTRSAQALTDVEAFGLLAHDLKNLFIEHKVVGPTELNSNCSMKEAARIIQLAWCRHHARRNRLKSTL